MARYIRDLFTKEWKWVEDEPVKFAVPKPVRRGLQIIKDIDPYKSVITGEVIGGRVQHREHLRIHDVIEVGNERPKPRQAVPMPSAKDDVQAAAAMVREGYRPARPETYRENEFPSYVRDHK